jgi:hypothetical protein
MSSLSTSPNSNTFNKNVSKYTNCNGIISISSISSSSIGSTGRDDDDDDDHDGIQNLITQIERNFKDIISSLCSQYAFLLESM